MSELPDKGDKFMLNGELLKVRRRGVRYGPPEVCVILTCIPVATHQQRLERLQTMLERWPAKEKV